MKVIKAATGAAAFALMATIHTPAQAQTLDQDAVTRIKNAVCGELQSESERRQCRYIVDLFSEVFAQLAKPPPPEIIVYRGANIVSVAENTEGAHVAKLIFKNAYFPEADDHRFEITPQGILKLKDHHSLDFEEESEVRVTITACSEDGSECPSAHVTIIITDVNEPLRIQNEPPIIQVAGGGDADSTVGGITASFTVSENSTDAIPGTAGAVLGLVTISDPDGQTHIFTVDDNRFQVIDLEGARWLTLKPGQSLDYEKDGPMVRVTLTVTDDGTPPESAAAEVTITIFDVDETPPSSTYQIERVEFYQGQLLDMHPRPTDFEPLPAIIETTSNTTSETRPTMMLVRATSPINATSLTLELVDRGGAPLEWQQMTSPVINPMWNAYAPSAKNKYGEREIAFDITDAIRPLAENADAPFPRFGYILTDSTSTTVARGHLPDVKVLPGLIISYVQMSFTDSNVLPDQSVNVFPTINALKKTAHPFAYSTLPMRHISPSIQHGVRGGAPFHYNESEGRDGNTRKRPSELLYEASKAGYLRGSSRSVHYYVGLYPGDTAHINARNSQGRLSCGESIQITDPQSGNINALPRIIALLYDPENYGLDCSTTLAHELGHALSLVHPWQYAEGDFPYASDLGFTLPNTHGHYGDYRGWDHQEQRFKLLRSDRQAPTRTFLGPCSIMGYVCADDDPIERFISRFEYRRALRHRISNTIEPHRPTASSFSFRSQQGVTTEYPRTILIVGGVNQNGAWSVRSTTEIRGAPTPPPTSGAHKLVARSASGIVLHQQSIALFAVGHTKRRVWSVEFAAPPTPIARIEVIESDTENVLFEQPLGGGLGQPGH
ncbi:MAG: hypothetical protein OXF66_09205 [Gammaproteobacteria bacterium]|nr:hypothetical protein [Gammaproteobacteria bacterium]MCY4166444.1 hypothetical protein [Gammaproteobacteria bacterium]MCY4254890.1 hypothetical protein [Gammaproteobacteria bacterium]